MPWSLSAAATAMLLEPGLGATPVLALALKELVLRGAWRVESAPSGRWRRPQIALAPGVSSVPALAPLPALDAALRRILGDDGSRKLDDIARQLVREAAIGVRDETRAELAGRGLVLVERRRVLRLIERTTVRRTSAGDELAREAADRIDRLAAAPPAAAAHDGLVLLAAPEVLAEIEGEIRRGRGDGEAINAAHGFHYDHTAFSSIDSAFDSASGGGSGADGGDGGGGGGDGGG